MLGRWLALAGLVAGVLVLPTSPAGATDAGAVVRTDSGPVRGVAGSFQGIPFAAPPVGSLRWRSPRPPAPWRGIRDASKPGSECPQAPDGIGGQASANEDCLYLNVTTPTIRRDRPRPVMVWVHGGGFLGGAGSRTDARELAGTGDVVVVTINYRLGVFGFFGYPGLAGSGTFGLQDQQAALRWVRHNAAAFGGDPGNVTVFGESAGGDSMCALLASPTAAGLFDRIIIESSSCTHFRPLDLIIPGAGPAGDTWKPVDTVRAAGSAMATTLGCEDMECLRDKPVPDVLAAQGAVYWSPAIGTPVLPEHPADAMRSGRFNRVPALVGTTRDEGTLLAAGFDKPGHPFSEQDYQGLAKYLFGDRAAEVIARYPTTGITPSRAWASIITDMAYACPNLTTDRVLSGWIPIYSYEFADRTAPLIFPIPSRYPMDAYHGSELAYVFGHSALTPAQRVLSRQMMGYWSHFAATGTASWPRFRAGDYVQSLAPNAIRRVDLGVEHQCEFHPI